MQKTSEDDYQSFFQVGGIHGLPYTAWDGALSTKGGDRGPGGYCTHGSVLFPTWHRPYVALYEVRIKLPNLLADLLTEVKSPANPTETCYRYCSYIHR